MSDADMALAVTHNAASKLADDDLLAISHFGFRGEATPSIASVAVLAITSRPQGAERGWQLAVSHGKPGEMPTASDIGTQIEISDLFGSIPARLKFLKTRKTEAAQCLDVVKRLAMASPAVPFICVIRAKICLALLRSRIMKRAGRPIWPR